MKRKLILTSALVAAALCFTGLPQAASAQKTDAAEDSKEAKAAEAKEAAEEAKAAKEPEVAKTVVIDARLLAKYKGMLA